MKLSLPVIAERLELSVAVPLPENASEQLYLPRPIFYTGEKILRTDTLYLCRGQDLPARISLEERSALICIGLPEKTASDKVLTNILIMDPSVDIFKLHNAINRIYDQLEDWEELLTQILQTAEPETIPQKLLDASEKIFGNALALLDPDQKILAQTSSFKINADDTEQISKDISRGDLLLYRLVAVPSKQPFRKGDLFLLTILAQFLERFARQESGIPNSGNPQLAALFASAIDSGHLSKRSLDSELKKINRSAQGEYELCVLMPETDSDAPLAELFAADLQSEFPDIIVFLHKQSVVAVVNRDFLSDETEQRHFIHFVRQNSYRIGVSNHFESLYEIRRYFRQALAALDIGIVEKPEEWVYRFSDYALTYIFRKAEEEFPPEELLSPVYYRLKEYDAKNNTDYINTLRVYLKNQQNAVQTAKDLFIHRGTILYRIKRICEIGETDLKEPNDLLHLYITLHMMEDPKEKGESNE